MFDTIWKIRKEGVSYRITLDPTSFNYNSFPKQDRGWTNNKVEELMREARIITQTNIQASDHYGKIEEYGDIFFEVDEEVIKEVRHEGEREAKTYLRIWRYILVGFFLLIILYFKIKFG